MGDILYSTNLLKYPNCGSDIYFNNCILQYIRLLSVLFPFTCSLDGRIIDICVAQLDIVWKGIIKES